MEKRDDKKIDKEEIEEEYNRELEMEKDGDLDEDEKEYEEVMKIEKEDKGGDEVRIERMGRGEVKMKENEEYVEKILEKNEEMFDKIMVDKIGYDVKLKLREMMIEMEDEFNEESMIDMGCGKGI